MYKTEKKDRICKDDKILHLVKEINNKIVKNKRKLIEINSILNTIENEVKQMAKGVNK